MFELPERSEIGKIGRVGLALIRRELRRAEECLAVEEGGGSGPATAPVRYWCSSSLSATNEDERKAMALNAHHIADRLFEQIATERFDVTITVSDSGAPERWLRLRGNSINLPHPHNGSPEEVLPAFDIFRNLPWGVDSWEAGRYVTVTVDWGPPGKATESMGQRIAIGIVLERMLENYLGLPVDSERWFVVEE